LIFGLWSRVFEDEDDDEYEHDGTAGAGNLDVHLMLKRRKS